MKTLTEQFNELAYEIQDEAMDKNNIDLFKQISMLRSLMFDIKTEQYGRGCDMVLKHYEELFKTK